MSAIGCILHADSAPTDPGDLRRILCQSSARGPDGMYCWSGPGVALGFLSFATTPGGSAAQPAIDRSGRFAGVFDGRLDNRDELCAALPDAVPNGASDADIVLQAFAKWGADTPARLLGDFAVIFWDGMRRRLIAARDHIGVRPLHFWESSDVLVCATDMVQVLAHPRVPREPDAATVADYLSLAPRNSPPTLYRGVSRLPAGHMLIADRGIVRVQRYWAPEPRTTLRYRGDDEYAAQCRELIVRSVHARLRSERPVAALLSGGLDSSAVVAIATRGIDSGERLPATFSMVFPDRPEADEREFIAAVARHCGVASHAVAPRRLDSSALHAHAAHWLDCPGFPSDLAVRGLYETIRDRGYRTVLTGCGGDYLFGGSVFAYADLLRGWQLVAVLRQWRADMRTDSTGWDRSALLRAGVWPLLPVAVKRALRPFARRVSGFAARPQWLRLRGSDPENVPERPRGGSFATEAMIRDLESGLYTLFLECGERAMADVPLEARHPLLDVRLVEFALAVPEDQRRRGPWIKYVLRGALGADLPHEVVRRRSKADFGYVLIEAIDCLGGAEFFRSLRIAECGWVDAVDLAARYQRAHRLFDAGDEQYGSELPSLWMVAAMELWFGAAFGGTPSYHPGGGARYHRAVQT